MTSALNPDLMEGECQRSTGSWDIADPTLCGIMGLFLVSLKLYRKL